MPHVARYLAALLAGLVLAAGGARAEAPAYVNFESGPVRPLALSPDGTRLYAVNTPDNRLEVFEVGEAGLRHLYAVAVGLEPVAVAVRTNGDVWVVNHLSDSLSVVDPATRSVRTSVWVGDEPRDIVFAGPDFSRVFVTTARRGQRRSQLPEVVGAGDPLFTTPGVPRADVWVFEADDPEVPLKIVELFGDTPRPLAASPDGSRVYAGVFYSGNKTMGLNSGFVCPGWDTFEPCRIAGVLPAPGGQLGPRTNHQGLRAPEVGLILKENEAGRWLDAAGRDWTGLVRFDLPDKDVFEIDAETLEETASYTGVGTTLFNIAVHPHNGKLYVSNSDSHNEVRFEGPGVFGGSTVQGHLAEARITVIDGADVLPRHLNKHIDYTRLASHPGFDPGQRDASLATPLGMQISADGSTLFVAAFGSSRVGVYATAEIDADSFDPVAASAGHIEVSGGGPGGLALDDATGRLYVWTRFDNGVSVVDLASRAEIDHVTFHSPEPSQLVEGRRFLYDARETSANGEASCSSCHVFGNLDHLGWDLGDPDADVKLNVLDILNEFLAQFSLTPINGTGKVRDFHPMKGPMTTQTLRGMRTHGAMHWRGDRSNGLFGVDATDEELSFRNFSGAFEGLVGREAPLDGGQMQRFADFALTLTQPPNPVRALDNSSKLSQAIGQGLYQSLPVDAGDTCETCHAVDASQGFFGASGAATFEGGTQIFKVPHLRNLYTKVGMFGLFTTIGEGIGFTGDQVRGFGFSHDGSVDTLFRFVSAPVFAFPNTLTKRGVEQFLFAFPTDLAPVVGQQVTLDAAGTDADLARVDLLVSQAAAPFTSAVLGGATAQCELVVKGNVGGVPHGWLRLADGSFQRDDGTPPVSDAELRALARSEGPLTYTCAVPGTGERLGLDRDGDGIPDGLDNCSGLASADQSDRDGDGLGDLCDFAQPVDGTRLAIGDSRRNRLDFRSRDASIAAAEPGSRNDPRCREAGGSGAGGSIRVASEASGESFAQGLPCEHWTLLEGSGVRGYAYRDRAHAEGPCSRVVLRAQRHIKVRCAERGGAVLDYSLDRGRSQDPVQVELRTGIEGLYCARFADGIRRDGRNGRRFTAVQAGTAPSCP